MLAPSLCDAPSVLLDYSLLSAAFCRPSAVFYRSNKSIPFAGNGFDKSRGPGWIVERLAEFLDGLVQTLIEVTARIAWPERPLQILACEQFSRAAQQKGK